ncbi:hypothetical protein [Streptomyces sp. NPDC018693]|uniref:hypothetical protein n=1 Tax=unclassified Streptomyces TaxID=2593676 RepID=UPI00379A23FE
MKNLFTSFIRTLTPWGVALVLAATGWLGIPVDSTMAAAAVTVGLGAVYYAAFRGLEALAERLAWRPLQVVAGVLLGLARPPAYEQPAAGRVPVELGCGDRSFEDFLRRTLRDSGGGDGAGRSG